MNTDELKKRYDDLKSQRGDIEKRLGIAQTDYYDALMSDAMAAYAEAGILPGSKCVAVYNRFGREKRTACGFLGVEVWYGGVRPALSTIKKDGTPGKSKRYIPCDRLEPFTEST